MKIKTYQKYDARVDQMLNEMPMISRVILFGGERFFDVSYVCIAYVEDTPVGIASLSREDKPLLEGIWVKPGFRRQGVATELLDAVVEL